MYNNYCTSECVLDFVIVSEFDFVASQPFVQPRSQDRGSQKMTNEQALEVKWLAYCTSIAFSFT